MAKKKVQTEVDEKKEELEVVEPDVVGEEEPKAKNKKANKEPKTEQVDKKSNKKPNAKKKQKKSLAKTANEVISEFKKVSKPSFGKVVKNTCVVVAVVAICTVLLFGMDRLFMLVYNLLLS